VLQSIPGEQTAPQPAWIHSTASDLDAVLGLEKNWDGHNSRPVQVGAARRLFEILLTVGQFAPFAPWVSATSDGGVIAEWRTDVQLLQVEVERDLEATVLYQSHEFSRYWEGTLGEEPDGIEKMLWRMRHEG